MVGEVKLMRLPINTKCADKDCGKPLPFGTWAHYVKDSKEAICIECGAKRGWTDKDRANNIIKKLELQEDVKALREHKKRLSKEVFLMQERVDLHRFGERILDLEKQSINIMAQVQSYFQHCATPEEKVSLQRVCDELQGNTELQKEIREQLESRLFLLERAERKPGKKLEPLKVMPDV